jgi:hypothetical protein
MMVIHITNCRIWGLHSGGYEEYHLLGRDAVYSVELQLNRLHGVISQKMILFILPFFLKRIL